MPAPAAHKSQSARRAAMLAAVVASLVYLAYRGLFTLNLDSWFAGAFSVTLYAAEVYGCALMFLYFFQIWDLHDPDPVPAMPGRTVDIFIPTYNEDPDLLRGTITAALAVDYPHRTLVLDDGDRQEVRELCEELGAEWVRRDDNLHAKAGNVNHAMEITDGEFVIILDADHVAESHFIDRTLGYFADERLAFVQTPHAFYNYDNFQGVLNYRKGIYWEEGQLFYNCTQPGKNKWNAVSFCGSAAIFRRAALETVGLIATESITEDLHTGLRLHSKGWKSLFVNERLISGQAAPDITTFHSQRLRWGEGNLGVMFFDNPATMPGLTLAQRLCYLGSMLCWTTGVQKLILYVAPILMLATGVAPVASLSTELVAVTLVYLLCVWGGVKIASGGYGQLIAIEMTAMASYWTQVKSCWRATFGRAAAKFVVTSKRGRQSDSTLRELKPQLFLIAAGAAAVAWAGGKIICGVSGDVTGFAIGSALVGVNGLFALEVIRRALKMGDKRFSWRHPVAAHVRWAVDAGDGVVTGCGVTRDLNERGAGFLAFDPLPDAAVADTMGRRPPAAAGTPVALRITAAGRRIDALGEIRSVTGIADSRGTKGLARAVRYGVRFDETSLSTAALDAIWDVSAKYGVARQYERFRTGRGFASGSCLPAEGEEVVTNLPAELRFLPPVEGAAVGRDPLRHRPGVGGDPLPGGVSEERVVTETLGPDTFGVLLTAPREAGSLAEVALSTPGGTVRAWAGVTSVRPVRVGGRELFAHRLTFRRFAGQGRGVIRGLVHRADTAELRDAVKLVPEKIRPPVLRPVAAGGGVAALAASALLAAGLFTFRDDHLMTHVAATAEATPGELLRLSDLSAEMRATNAFDEARLLRLRGAFTALDETREVVGLNELLVNHSPQTPAGRFRKAESLMALGRHREAEPIFAALLEDLVAFPLAWTRRECVVAAGRCAANLGDYALAADRFGRYVELDGPVDAVRVEWAGLLARSGRRAKAIRVLTGGSRALSEMPAARRRLLAPLQLAAHDTAAAAATYRSLLAEDPGDTEAALGLARVALDAGEEGATEAFRVFLAEHPDDPAARLGLARSLTADGNPAAAEQSLRELLAETPDHPEVWPAYLALLTDPKHAAAPVAEGGAGGKGVTVGPPQRAVVAAIAARAGEAFADDDLDAGPFFLQLIAALRVAGDDADLAPVRERFVALPAPTPTRRLRRAEVLTDLGRRAEAAGVLDGLFAALLDNPAVLPDPADRLAARLAAARSAADTGRFAAAHARFESALAAGAPAAPLRAERAGVLAELGRPTEGLAVLTANLPPAGGTAGDGETGPAANFAPPLGLDERVQLAGLRGAAGDPGTAAADLAAIVAEHPTHRPAVLLSADLSMGLGRHAAAARLYAEAVALDPAADAADGDRAAIARGWALTELGETDAAEEAFRALLVADPDRPELWTPYLATLTAADAAVGDGAAANDADRPLPPARRAALKAILARRSARAADGVFLLQLIAAARRADVPDDLAAVRAEFVRLPADSPAARLRRAEALSDLARHADAGAALDDLWETLETDPLALPAEADRLAARTAAARSAARRGDFAVAAERFAAAVAAGVDPAGVRGERAGVLAELDRPADAVAVLTEPSAVPLTRAERGQLGGLHAAAGDNDAALAVLTELLAGDPDDLAATRLLADVSAGAGRFADAARLYARVVALDPAADAADGDRAAVARGWALVESGDLAAAEASFRALLAADPDRAELWTPYLAALAALEEQAHAAGASDEPLPEDRRAVVRAILSRRADRAADGPFLLQLIAAARRAGVPADLTAVREEFARLPADTPTDRLRRAEVLTDLGRHDEAAGLLDALWAALAEDPAALPKDRDRVAALVASARSAAFRDDLPAAAERFAAAVDAGADPAGVRSQRAGVLADLGRPAEAVAVLAAPSPVPLDRAERAQLGGLHAAAGDLPAAVAALSGLLAEGPDDLPVTRLLADVSAAAGDFRRAARLYGRVVELDPAADAADGDRARIAAANALAEAGEPAAAEAGLRPLLAADADRPTLWPAYLSAFAAAVREDGLVPGETHRAVVAAIDDRRGERAGDGAFLLRLAAASRALSETPDPRDADAVRLAERRTDRLRAEFVALPAATPTDRLRRAEALTDLGRHADAARALDALWDELALNPAALPDPADRAAARTAAARSAARTGRFAVAAARFDAAVAAGADADEIRGERAGVLYELDRPAEGAAVLTAGLRAPTDDPFAPMDAQIGSSRQRRVARPLSHDERVQLAGLHAAAGRLAAAADVLRGLIEDAPDDRAATLLLADVSAGLQRFPDAARYYERAVRLDPAADAADGDRARVAAAYARSWGGDAKGAEWSFRRLLTEEFDRPDLWTPYLEAAGMLKELPPASRPLIAALWDRRGRRAGDRRFLLTLTAAVNRTGETARVVELLTALTAGPDTPPDLLRWLAASLDAQGEYEEAAAVYDRLLAWPAESDDPAVSRFDSLDAALRESVRESAGDESPVLYRPARGPEIADEPADVPAGRRDASRAPRRSAALWPVGRW